MVKEGKIYTIPQCTKKLYGIESESNSLLSGMTKNGLTHVTLLTSQEKGITIVFWEI